jgi:16S rRNA G1207 methylase RsmC
MKQTEHYYSKEPTSTLIESHVLLCLKNHEIPFTTASGLFSIDRIDPGTLLMIESVEFKKSVSLLDLGCGWGAVGITLKVLNPLITVTCSDVNKRALTYTKKNAKQNCVDIQTIESDGLANIPNSYDYILLNPPHSAGKELCIRLITDAKKHLVVGGKLIIVARKNKGGETLAKHMKEIYGNVEVISKRSGFFVYGSILE